ncbi:flavin reductase (DIM6/NTAB) family NADH-FMN oxidoreductase RutF [Homoserinimonas aerilata]|uniref:Flavin reductase (DIM6/NTAB) family NADH-FMN oxidoreductase RutF n=1 Tax=Homoserinimonas aerilata TaxID=1162970 RepID=A0A542YHB4_9MICO|nr:flavin reductase family protein [Homoserinimonas aerilata]TQL47492.1 flavin reductase (DIM6/NTAB) family NADH-FMN oxidoreductase RutF [Homoserinimonas aerilata]
MSTSAALQPQGQRIDDSIEEPQDARHRFEGLTASEFKTVFRNHPAGVAVITADAGDGPVGLTATSVFSVSAEPPLLVFSVSSQSSSAPTILAADTVVVHLLGAEQLDIATLCATSDIDRFADTTIWDTLPSGEPYFTASDTWIRGRVVSRMEAGNSTVVAVHALEASVPDDLSDADPLVYHNRTWHSLGEHSRI